MVKMQVTKMILRLEEDWKNSEDSHQWLVDDVHSSGLPAGRSRRQANRDLPGNLGMTNRGTQRLFSVKYLFGEVKIAYNFV